MYNLLMSGRDNFWEGGTASTEQSRYLEHTHEALQVRFRTMTDEVIDQLKQIPTLFAYEKDTVGLARVGFITEVRRLQSEYELAFEFVPIIRPLDSAAFQALWPQLDVNVRGEGNRTHWAIKEVDLLATLAGVGWIQPNLAIAPPSMRAMSHRSTTSAGFARPKVFIVHGRAEGPKNDVARFLTQMGLEPIILHERPNGGRTLISKFQEESADVAFAVVLMTPDDFGGLNGGLVVNKSQPRARQNVIFELGFFIGKLGPAKVCALVQGAIEKPSDFDAVVYIPYDGTEAWKIGLARELKHAGLPTGAGLGL